MGGDVEMDKTSIGKRVRRQRESLSLTRDQFSEQIGISPQFLAEIENGKKGMSAETLQKICDRADASSDYILFGRQAGENVNTPAIEMIKKVPPQYCELLEDTLETFLRTIKKAENKQ